MKSLKQVQVKKDGILAWVICISALINNAIVNGIDCSFGVIIGSLIKKLDSSAATVSWISSIHTSSMFLFAWVSTILTQKYGFRVVIIGGVIVSCLAYMGAAFSNTFTLLILTYGVLGGAGSGLLFAPGNIVSSYYFENQRAIATGIAMCGSGVGVAIISPLANYLNINFGAQSVFVAFSLLALLSLFLGILTFPTTDKRENDNKAKSSESQASEDGYKTAFHQMMINLHGMTDQVVIGNKSDLKVEKKISSRLTNHRMSIIDLEFTYVEENEEKRGLLDKFSLLKDPRLIFYCLTNVMFELAFYIPVVYLPEMMVTDHGFPQSVEGTIIAVLGASNIVGKLFSGVISKLFQKNCILISAITLVCLGSGSLGLAFCSEYGEYIGTTVSYGIFMGSFDNLTVYILIEMYGVTDKFQDAYGLVMLAKMLSPIWGPPIGGALHDLTGAYYVAFYAAGLFQYTGAIFSFLVFVCHIKNK